MVKLYVIDGPNKGQSWQLGKDILFLGRGSTNDIRLKDPSVSSRHLRIQRKNTSLFIEDLHSTNGTFLNGQRISPGQLVEVQEGDLITVGGTLISLDAEFTLSGTLVQRISRGVKQLQKVEEVVLPKDRPMTAMKNLELIFKVSNALMQSFDVQEILEIFMDALFDCLKRIERGAILLIERGSNEVKEIIARSRINGERRHIRYSKSIVNKVISEGRPIVLADTAVADDADLSDSIRSMKIRSVMCVPLISRSHVRGAIYVDSLSEPHGFRKDDLRLLMALATPAAIALENALIYSVLERMVERRTQSLKEAENRLRKSEARFRAIFDNMESGVIVCKSDELTGDFSIIDINQAAERIDKVIKREAIGKNLGAVFSGFEQIGMVDLLKEVLEQGTPRRLAETFYEGERSRGWREFDIHRLPSGELVIIYRDITEKKRAEEEQRVLERKLMHSQKLESVGRLAGGVAHNFRNILQAILGNAEYLQVVKSDDDVVKETVSNINNSVDKGVDLIHSLLHFSRLGEDFEPTVVDLSEVIKDTHRIIERLFDKRILITMEVQENLLIKGNKSLLSQVFMNLFNNAKDAMPEGGKLTIRARATRDSAVIAISDTGVGMEKEVLDKIFDPFFTLKEVGKGSGLGLSTVHGIVKGHGGTISASSEPGKGSTFTLTFPLFKDLVVDGELKTLPDGLRFGKGEKVLVVDDEETILKALVSMTERLGYRVRAAQSGREAVDIYREWSPQIVLMDRNMPGMDGLTCMREIIKIDPEASVVIISGYEESGSNGIDEDAKQMIRGYMTKPCGIKDLSTLIADVLSDKQ